MTPEEVQQIKNEAYKQHGKCTAFICNTNLLPGTPPEARCKYARLAIHLLEEKKVKPIKSNSDFLESSTSVVHWINAEVNKQVKDWTEKAKGADWTAILEQALKENNSLKDDVKKLRKALVDIYNILPVNRPTNLDHLGFLYDISKLTFDALKPSSQSWGEVK